MENIQINTWKNTSKKIQLISDLLKIIFQNKQVSFIIIQMLRENSKKIFVLSQENKIQSKPKRTN